MRHLLPFLLFALCNLRIQSFPLPAGQFVQYSVSHKYFNRNNGSSNSLYDILSQIHYGGNAASTSSSLDQVTTTISNEKVDIKNYETTMTSMVMDVTNFNESPEAPAVTIDDVTNEDKNHHQLEIDATMKDDSSNNDEILTALIEKVVNEQIEKLASETDTKIKINLPNEQNEVIEKIDLVDETNGMSNTEKAQLDDDSETTIAINSEKVENEGEIEEKETTKSATIPAMSNIESVDLDSVSESSTIVPTNLPEITTNMETILNDNNVEHQDDAMSSETFDENEKVSEETSSKNEIPETLLNAVGDLLSSVLGISVSSNGDGVFVPNIATSASDSVENEYMHETTTQEALATTENDIVEHSTEQELSSSTIEFNEKNGNDELKTEATDVQNNKSTDEIDTSNIIMPEVPVVGSSNVIANEIDLKIENLANVHDTNFMTENTPEVYTETVREPSSDDIKNEDGILEALPELTAEEEATKPDSFQESVNHIMSVVKDTEDRLALENAHNIVDSVLIDHQTITDNVNQILNGALKQIETNFALNGYDKEIELPIDAIDVLDREREELIKNFETDINESLITSSIDYQDNFMPNMAKAALLDKMDYGDDF